LVQDAAYSSLTRGKRQQLHSAIANALKEHFSETVETQPELMAHHLEQAGLVNQAIDYFRIAGQRAIERSANAEAIGHLKHALKLLELLPANGQRARMAFGLEAMLARALIAARGYAAAETKQTLLRARALLDDSIEPSQKFAVLYGLWACYYVGGEGDLLQGAAAEAVRHAEELGHPFTLAYTIGHARGMMDVFRRRPDDTGSYALIVSICSEHGFPFWGASGQVLEGWAATHRGDTDRGLELLRAGITAWRETG